MQVRVHVGQSLWGVFDAMQCASAGCLHAYMLLLLLTSAHVLDAHEQQTCPP